MVARVRRGRLNFPTREGKGRGKGKGKGKGKARRRDATIV